VGELHPWMVDEATVDAEWVRGRYAVGDGEESGSRVARTAHPSWWDYEGWGTRLGANLESNNKKPRLKGTNGMGE